MQSVLLKWYLKAIDWLFPPTCGGCNTLGVRWCSKCNQATRQIQSPFCKQCGQHVPISGMCARCSELSSRLVAIRSWVVFEGPIRHALHRIKYNQDRALAGIFANSLGRYFFDQLNWPVEMIVPVPLSSRRKKSRGYNQAALLAKPLARELDLPYHNQALMRVRETRSQVGLSLVERRINVDDVFRAFPMVVNKNILIVDDVATSGSTLEACAKALKQAGAKAVYGLTLARAVLSP